MIDPKTGVNSFWLACMYGHGSIMKKLAEKGSDIFISNKEKVNVLHLAIYKDNLSIFKMLLMSNYPLDTVTNNGYNAI